MNASATASGPAAQGPIPIIIITGFIDEQEDKTYEAVYFSTIPTTGRGVYRIRYEGDAAYLFRPTPNATLDPFIHGKAPSERRKKLCEIKSCEYCALCVEYDIDAHAQQESLIIRGGGFVPWDPYFHWIANEQLLPLAPGFIPGRGSRNEGKCWIDDCKCRVTSLSTSDSDTCPAPPSIPETRAPSPDPFSGSPSSSSLPSLSQSAASVASTSSKMSEDGSFRRPKDATPHAESNESSRRSDYSLGCPCKQVEKDFHDQKRPYHFVCECDWWDHTPGHADVERRMQKPRYPVTACRRYNMHRYMSKRRSASSNACSFCRRKSELLAKGDAGFWAAPKSDAEHDHYDALFRRMAFALSPLADDPQQRFVSDDWDSCEDFFYVLPESAMPAPPPPPQARGSLFEWWLNQLEPVDPPPGGRRELVKVSIWRRIKIMLGFSDNPNLCKNCKLCRTRCECEAQ